MSAKRKGRKSITVDYLMDDCMVRDEWTTNGPHSVKIHADGRGHVRIDGALALYTRVERVVLRWGKGKRQP